jgi:hypothetical protein
MEAARAPIVSREINASSVKLVSEVDTDLSQADNGNACSRLI